MMKTQQTSRRESRTHTKMLCAVAVALTLCPTFFDVGSARAAEIKLMASAAVMSVLNELAPQFESATNHRVAMDFASVIPLKRRIDAGETFDVAILTPAVIDDLIKQGKVAANTRAGFARTGLGIAVPKGVAKPDITSVEALKRTLLEAKSIGYESEAQPGILFLDVLDRLGIDQDMRPRLRGYQTGMDKALERGEVEMTVSSIGALLAYSMGDLVGGFPPEVQRYISFMAGISAPAEEPEAARALLQFLMSPAATAVLSAKGLERD